MAPMLPLLVLSSASALTIEHPAVTSLSAGSGGTVWDVIPLTDGTVLVRTDVAASCTLYEGATARGSGTTVADGVSYSQSLSMSGGSAGAWYVACDDGTITVDEDFYVVSALTPAIWIDPDNDLSDIVELEYDEKGASFNHYNSKTYWTDGYAVRQAAWWYILDVGAFGASVGPDHATHANLGLPHHLLTNYTTTWVATTASDYKTPQDSIGGGTVYLPLLRLGLAHLLAHEFEACLDLLACDIDNDLGQDDALDLLVDDYRHAATYWGVSVATYDADPSDADLDWPTWGSGEKDLYVSRTLVGLAALYDWMRPSLSQEERHEWLVALAERTDGFYTDDTMNIDEDDATFDTDGPHYSHYETKSPTPWLNHRRRVLRNGHTAEKFASVGVVGLVLQNELEHGTGTTTNEWARVGGDGIADILAVLGEDGASSNGLSYSEDDVRPILWYLEADRTIGSGTPTADGWLDSYATFYRHMIAPDGRRVPLGDGQVYDVGPPSPLLSWTGRQLTSSTQRQPALDAAYEGHGADTEETGASKTASWSPGRRDVFDALWWRGDLWDGTPGDDAIYPKACFPDLGLVSVRSDWDADAVHLVYKGGALQGGHDDPASGSFWLQIGPDELVTSDGENGQASDAKRTALGATFTIDGKGQHGDGFGLTEAPPESTTAGANDARLIAYLDGSGPTHDPTTDIDVVTFGSDLTQAYRHDSGDDTRGVSFADVDGVNDSLDEVSRYVLWVGDPTPGAGGAGAILLYDRFASTNATWSVDWHLPTSDWFTDLDSDGKILRERKVCPATSGSSFGYSYTNGSAYKDILLSSGACTGCSSAGLADLNQGTWYPQVGGTAQDGSSCTSSIALYPSTGSPASAKLWEAQTRGWMEVVSAETLPSIMRVRPTAYLDGGTVNGWELRRTRTADDRMLPTWLLPATDGQNPVEWSAYTNGVPQGQKLSVKLRHGTTTDKYAVFAFLTVPGTDLFADAAGSSLDGRMGVVIHDDGAPGTRYGAHMLHATELVHQGYTLLTADDGASTPNAVYANVAVTYGATTVWGSFQGLPAASAGGGRIFVAVPWPAPWPPIGGLDVRIDGVLHPTTDWSVTSTGVYIDNISGDGRFSIAKSGIVTTYPRSHCSL